ncbi:MAG TPA: flagellar hook-length control protein FliK [Rhizomicrobium sp.]|nr:flagellar hook-length control protein FliK [Rhizomicrobium sp.]
MALGSANAVSPTPAVDNTAKANASVAVAGNGSGGTFTDSLEAVLALPGTAKTAAATAAGGNVTPFVSAKLAKLKTRLNSEAGAAISPQVLQQQAALQQLNAANTGIDMPALRAALGKDTQTPGSAHIMPAVNPLMGRISAAAPVTSAQADAAAPDPHPEEAANGTKPAAQNAASPAPAPVSKHAVSNTKTNANGTEPASNAAKAGPADAASAQAKLVTSLVRTARAPVLKTGQADGSAVPNAKIARPAKPEEITPKETVQSMAAKIAATAAVANTGDTAQTAAKGVAVAEVATRTAAAIATPAITRIEAAAMTNATQTAVHATAPQANIEAQALPVQFGAQPSKQDGDSGAKTGTDSKDQSQPGSARTANDASQSGKAPAANFADNAQPSAPAPHANTVAATTATANAAASTTAPVTPSHIATALHVSQQTQHSTPADDATFAALGVAIAAKSRDGEKQFDINMHPAELGRVDVRISVDADGKAQAHLSAEHPQTLQLLQNDKATLERNLRDAGLDVASNGLSFSLKGEQQPSTPTFNARSRALSISTVQTTDISSIASSSSSAPGDSRLDIRV